MEKIVVLIEDFEFHRLYKRGHHFTIIDAFSIGRRITHRGWDLRDEDGNCIYETLFIQNKFVYLSEWRNLQLNSLLDE